MQNNRTEILETASLIVDTIKSYQKWLIDLEKRKEQQKRTGLNTTFLDHKIIIYTKVIERLEYRYSKHLKKLLSLDHKVENYKAAYIGLADRITILNKYINRQVQTDKVINTFYLNMSTQFEDINNLNNIKL